MNSERYQAVVVGAGLVGAAPALALARRGLRVALIERAAPAAPAPEWDTRIYALTPANQRLLASLGVWARMDASRVQPVHRMDVSGDGAGRVRLDAYAAGTAQLAFIFESGRLQHALWEALLEDGGVAMHCPASIAALERAGTDTLIRLDDDTTLTTQLVTGADGFIGSHLSEALANAGARVTA